MKALLSLLLSIVSLNYSWLPEVCDMWRVGYSGVGISLNTAYIPQVIAASYFNNFTPLRQDQFWLLRAKRKSKDSNYA